MNILFLTHRLPYAPNRGDRIRSLNLMREMANVGRVTLVSLVHDDEEEAAVDRVPYAARVIGVRVPRMSNAVRGLLRLPSARPLTHSLLDAPGMHAAVVDAVSETTPDVVVPFCSSMARYVVEPPLDDLPFVLDMVDVDSCKWAEMATRTRGPLRWVYRREAATLGAFEARIAGSAQASLVVNERERAALLALAPDARVVVVPNGVDLDAFRAPGPPASEPVVIFCGVMDYGPNADAVRWFHRHVWPRVRARHPSARFVVVGGGAPADLATLAAHDPSVTLTGRVDRVQPHLWSAAVSVAPLQVARGVQNKVLEALAAGLPAVVTPVVFEGLPNETRAGCISAISPEEFAEGVASLLDLAPDQRRAVAHAADLVPLGWSRRLAGLRDLLLAAASAPRRAEASTPERRKRVH